jgi:hypothetical protein
LALRSKIQPVGIGVRAIISILYYNYCMMLWISRWEGLSSVTVNNL